MYKQIEGRAQAREGAAGKTVVGDPRNPWLTLTLGSKTRAHAGAGDRRAITLNLDRKFPNHNQYDMTSTSCITAPANISGTSSPPHKWTVQEIRESNSENVCAGTKWRSQYRYMQAKMLSVANQWGLGRHCRSGYCYSSTTPLAQLCCTLAQCHSVTWCVSSAHALVFEPNVRVNQGFWGSPTTVLPATPSRASALPSICLYIDLLYNTSNHAILVPCIVRRLLWARRAAGFRSLLET